eukprot:4684108-Prymnesium_polylepis.1
MPVLREAVEALTDAGASPDTRPCNTRSTSLAVLFRRRTVLAAAALKVPFAALVVGAEGQGGTAGGAGSAGGGAVGGAKGDCIELAGRDGGSEAGGGAG